MNNTQQKTEWRGLEIELQALENAVADCVEIPNEWLPKDFHDNVRGGRTISRIIQLCDTNDGLTAHKKKKAIKAKNIEIYRKSMDDHAEIDYNLGTVDQEQLYKNQQAFVEAQIQIGNIQFED